jgi:circadian clock protein KaiB
MKTEFSLRLYVTDQTPTAKKAVDSSRALLDGALGDRYELEVIDILENPELAEGDEVIATPTLVRKRPLPLRRVVGKLSNPQKVLSMLGIEPQEPVAAGAQSAAAMP